MTDDGGNRKRKGKMPMTTAQLEEEERKKKKKEEAHKRRLAMENAKHEKKRDKVLHTQLSHTIRSLLESGTNIPGPSQFSWDHVGNYGLTAWPTTPTSPLPEPEDQGDSDYCIAFSIYHILQMQANIAATCQQIPVPVISLDGMIGILKTFAETDQTMENVLECLTADNVPSNSKLGIDWMYGISPMECTLDVLSDRIAYAIKNFGAVLFEYNVLQDNRRRTTVKVNDEKDQKKTRQLGHVVVLYGCEILANGEVDFHVLNSYGRDYMHDGKSTLKEMCIELKDTHFVYVFQLRFL